MTNYGKFIISVFLILYAILAPAEEQQNDTSKNENIRNNIDNIESENAKFAAAKNAAEQWLALTDNAKYEKTWTDAAEYFKKVVNKKNWIQSISAIRSTLGKNISRNMIGSKFSNTMPGAPDGEYITFIYSSSFENKQNAIETIVTILEKDNLWRVAGYFIK